MSIIAKDFNGKFVKNSGIDKDFEHNRLKPTCMPFLVVVFSNYL